MIVRIWRGQVATAENVERYHRHVTENVLPELAGIAGHRGAYLLRRETASGGGGTEFLVVTLWDSIESVRAFAGDRVDGAVVEPEAKAVLSDFDDFVRHYEVAHGQPPCGESR
jgi:heme-degrading monooxygenase HmoA